MQIGSFGNVIFRVEEENILTIKAMSREKKSRWEEAQILNDLSFLEFRGRDLTTVSLDIQLIETSKMKIVDTLNTLNNMLENGENHELILGNTLIGEFPFVLESMSEKFEKHQEQGALRNKYQGYRRISRSHKAESALGRRRRRYRGPL